MAAKNWSSNAVTTITTLVTPTTNKAVTIASLYITNTHASSTANVQVHIRGSNGTDTRATIAKPVLLAGETFTIGAIAFPAVASSSDILRIESDVAVSCFASGDES
jgi:hypothetical protein